jgi:hypothetical protein
MHYTFYALTHTYQTLNDKIDEDTYSNINLNNPKEQTAGDYSRTKL